MELRFDMPEVARWADFSGDYNPIHFDLERARDLGTDALIVHGMLALMPVKRELTVLGGRADANATPPAWRRFRALLRAPIPHGGRLQLSTRSGTRGLQFRADSSELPEEFFRGSFSDGEDPAIERQQQPVILADTPLDAAQFASFRNSYGDGDGWIALDAVLFADFMRTKIGPLHAWTRARAGARMAAEIEQALIVHTSHTVTYSTAACAPGGSAWRAGSELVYDVHAPDVIPGDGQVICTVPLAVKADGVIVMAVELGLLLKTPLVR